MLRISIALVTVSVFLSSCSVDEPAPLVIDDAAMSVGILVYGDTGYHPDYPDQDDYVDLFSEEEFLQSEQADWLDDKRPADEYEPRPSSTSPVTGKVVGATGIFGISEAMTNYCRDSATCDFGVMLGDNIYRRERLWALTDRMTKIDSRTFCRTPLAMSAISTMDF